MRVDINVEKNGFLKTRCEHLSVQTLRAAENVNKAGVSEEPNGLLYAREMDTVY